MKKQPSENALIAKYFAPLASDGAFNLQDDAAILEPQEGKQLVITQDAIAQDVHFFSDDPADLIAQKALRVNLSDLAAKGAEPRVFSLALGLPKPFDEGWVELFAQGLMHDMKIYDIELTGGDTFHSGAGIIVSITAIGELEKDEYRSRLDANVGDKVYVSGTIGDGALGLLARQGKLSKLLTKSDIAFLENRYLHPQPRCEYANLIREYASASMDVSDGLVGDLAKMCQASGVAAQMEITKLPLSKAAKAALEVDEEMLEVILAGGDDYELIFTVSPEKQHEFDNLISNSHYNISQIGEIILGNNVTVLDASGQKLELKVSSYDHLV